MKKHRITNACIKAMDLCYEADPEKRGTLVQVAWVLHKALKREEENQKDKNSSLPSKKTSVDVGKPKEKAREKPTSKPTKPPFSTAAKTGKP
jgi:hypothetical protein